MLIDGKALAEKVKVEVKTRVDGFAATPVLAVILVGDNPASEIYVRGKIKDCEECGIESRVYQFAINILQDDLIDFIGALNTSECIDGILVQLPLPQHIDQTAVINAIDPKKDVDCFHPINVGRLAAGCPYLLPCTPAGIMRMLEEYKVDVAGKYCVVIGRSNIVGKPMSQLLLQADGTVTTCHSKTQGLGDITRDADILISAVGKPMFVRDWMVKEGAVVIDVGMNRVNGKLCGDVDFAEVKKRASLITPVPGGVGPMTRAMLMENVVRVVESK